MSKSKGKTACAFGHALQYVEQICEVCLVRSMVVRLLQRERETDKQRKDNDKTLKTNIVKMAPEFMSMIQMYAHHKGESPAAGTVKPTKRPKLHVVKGGKHGR